MSHQPLTIRAHLERIVENLDCLTSAEHAKAALHLLDNADRPRPDVTYQYVPARFRLVADPAPPTENA